MGKKKLPPGFVYERQPPQMWVSALAELAPRTDHRPWLHLCWMSGDPWEEVKDAQGFIRQYGVQRWVIYEMVPMRIWVGLIQQHRGMGKKPDEIMEHVILEELRDKHPRDRGYYDTVLDRFISESLVSRQEWELCREFKAVPKLYWVIQGSHGGHRRVYSPLEVKYLGMAGLPTDPPLPGTLPYADFDQRVMIQLARRDRLHAMAGRLSHDETERDEQLVEFRRQLVQMVTDQQRAALEEQLLSLEGIPTSHEKADDPTGMIEESIDRFIQTGSLHQPPSQEP